MSVAKIEHANLSVTDPDRSSRFFQKLCGWEERWRGPSMMGGETIHVGSHQAYIALYTHARVTGGYDKGQPLNHIGIAVDDLEAAEKIVLGSGLKTFSHSAYDPGPRSFYFLDWDGIEFEIVCYG
ncbi:VOC family protein [Altererythrobacter aquiaggeris]|uniref:VOC family protein n=1 Tax=Aestuarierythrobacter aquiaggeris TaxID=1898396 RepID=UPI003016424E